MFKLIVDNKEIYIRKNTSVQLEVNNSIFSTEKTEGEVIFTFDVPAKQNDLIFNHARFVYVERMKKYDCRIEVSGYEIAHGDLYIQNSDYKTYSVGVVVNPYPDNFQSKDLNENDFGDPIVISESVSVHNEKWKSFLKSSLDPDSNIKFPLFLDPLFYGNSNPDFGYYQMISSLNVSGNPYATLTNIKSDPDHKFVNRLFFDNSRNVVEQITNNKGIRLFNKQGASRMNSFTFCPAFRLLYILEKLFENAGYRLTGSFKTDPFAGSNFVQSLRSLDGNKLQYDVYNVFSQVIFKSPATFSNYMFAQTNINNIDFSMGFDVEDVFYKTFSNLPHNNVTGTVNIKTYIPETALERDSLNNVVYRLAFLIVNNEDPLPKYCRKNGEYGAFPDNSRFPSYKGGFMKILGDGIIGSYFGFDGADYYELSIDFTTSIVNTQNIISRKYKFVLAKIGLHIDPEDLDQQWFEIVSWDKFYPNTNFETSFYNHNIFAKEFNIADFMPNLTNSTFVNEICKTFGVAQYTDSTKKEVEFSLIKDILKTKKFIDITEYCTDKVGLIGDHIEKKYSVDFGTETEETLPEGFIDPIEKFADILPAKMNVGKFCYVREQNSIYQSVPVTNEDGVILTYKWSRFSSNIMKKTIGVDGDSTDVSSNFKIPYQKIGIKTLNTPTFPVINYTGYSPILHSENQKSEFPAFLLTYYGTERFYYDKNGSYVNKEAFRVINPDKESGMDLTVNTENSVVNNLISPWLNFISNYETVTHHFSFPPAIFMRVLKTLKSQDKPVLEQERFIVVKNVKMLPIKMNFEFKVSSDLVTAKIEFAKEKIVH